MELENTILPKIAYLNHINDSQHKPNYSRYNNTISLKFYSSLRSKIWFLDSINYKNEIDSITHIQKESEFLTFIHQFAAMSDGFKKYDKLLHLDSIENYKIRILDDHFVISTAEVPTIVSSYKHYKNQIFTVNNSRRENFKTRNIDYLKWNIDQIVHELNLDYVFLGNIIGKEIFKSLTPEKELIRYEPQILKIRRNQI